MPIIRSYNKLIRDNIPSLLQPQGIECRVKEITDPLHLSILMHQKLDEEVQEFHNNCCAEEAADIIEILYALAERYEVTPEAIEESRLKKLAEKGGFKLGLHLTTTTEK